MLQNINTHYIQPIRTFNRDARLFLWMTVISVLNVAWQIGWSVGPYLSGLVQVRYGFSPLFITTTVLYLLAVGVMWKFFGSTENAPAAAAV